MENHCSGCVAVVHGLCIVACTSGAWMSSIVALTMDVSMDYCRVICGRVLLPTGG